MAVENTDNHGWIKLHRKSLDSQVWQNPHLWQLWCYCLLRATHKPFWASVKTGRGQTEVYLESGQFVFGRFSAAEKLKAKPDATYKRLLKLKKLGNVTTQNRTHFTVVSLCNWDLYQNSQIEITTQVTPKYHPSNTNKNVKNDKNDKNKKKARSKFIKPTVQEVSEYAKNINYTSLNSQLFVDTYEARGWMIGKNKMKDWRAAVRTWKGRDNDGSSKISGSNQPAEPFIR